MVKKSSGQMISSGILNYVICHEPKAAVGSFTCRNISMLLARQSFIKVQNHKPTYK